MIFFSVQIQDSERSHPVRGQVESLIHTTRPGAGGALRRIRDLRGLPSSKVSVPEVNLMQK